MYFVYILSMIVMKEPFMTDVASFQWRSVFFVGLNL